MLRDNQRLTVRINDSLQALEFTIYEYVSGIRYEKAHAVPFYDLPNPAFDLGDLLTFLQSKMPSAFPSYQEFLAVKSLEQV